MARKKGLMYRWIMGRDDRPDITEAKLPGTRLRVFKDILSQRLGALVKTNMLMLLFALPALIWYYVGNSLMNGALASYLPYNGNYGTGYPVIGDLEAQRAVAAYANNMTFALLLIPCLTVAGLGLGGGFHVIKLLVWGEGVSVSKDFFAGVKRNAFQFAAGATLLGGLVLLVIWNASLMPLIEISPFLEIVSRASAALALLFGLFFVMYYFTQAEAYKLKTRSLVKNSFILSFGMLPRNFLFMVLSLLPAGLMFVPLGGIFSMLFMFVMLLLGVSFTALVWTIYTQYVYDRFVNDGEENKKDKGVWRKKVSEANAAAKVSKAVGAVPMTSIDHGKTFKPLSEGFSRADLDRLAEEKAAVKDEIDKELESVGKRRAEITDEAGEIADKGDE